MQHNVGSNLGSANRYNLEGLNPDNSDYQLIVNSFIATSSVRRNQGQSSCNFIVEKIFRVKPQVARSVDGDNVLVFHGTPRENVGGILKNGFIPSTGQSI